LPASDLAPTNNDERAKDYVAHDLQHHIKSCVSISTQLRFVEIGGIERSVGKARRVIDKRPR